MDRKAFYGVLRAQKLYGPTMEQSEVDGTEAVLNAVAGWPLAWQAYALATAFWETARTMLPVEEAYWIGNADAWRKKNLRYYPWHGRGYVQLTWRNNYERADRELGLQGSLIANADRAMEPEIAARILRRGMEEGWFAFDSKGRHTCARHLPSSGPANQGQFEMARRIINGVDKRREIARIALSFQRALAAGGLS
jgi:putative chitinase